MSQALSRAIRTQNDQGRLGVIAEIKRRRADRVELVRDRVVTEIARTYQQAGAAALSVVTSAWFGGRLEMLEQVASANLGLPILRKDLIASEKDIQVSKRLGAAAVLLVLPILGIERLAALLPAVRAEQLEPFVEVATRQEIAQLRPIYDGIIAVNNSDIKTNEVEGEGIARSLALIDRRDPRLWVSASGIGGAGDVKQVAAVGFRGILIGTHLLLASDLRTETDRVIAAARIKPSGTPRPIVKICGVTSEEEVQRLSECGADFFGLQLDMPSPWSVSFEQAKQLAARGDRQLRATLITRPADPSRLAQLVAEIGVRAIQLSPLTPPEHIRRLREHFQPADLTILAEISYRGGTFWKEDLVAAHLAAGADYLLIDPIRNSHRGDNAADRTIPASDLSAFRERHAGVPILIAGGISADNVQTLMSASGAAGIDVCSSVRRDGLIERDLVARLIERLAESV